MKSKTASSRRDFIKISAAGAAGVVMAPAVHAANINEPYNKIFPEKTIIYRTLGKTGFKVPVISSGAISIDNDNLVRAVMRSGILHIDTAHGYHKGKNEEVLGKLLKDFNRDDFVIGTKVDMPQDEETGLFTEEATTEEFLRKLDISLERLGMESVDILYLHSVENKEGVLNEQMLKALKIAKEKGKTRFTGVSTHKNEPEVIQAAIDSKFYDVVLTAINYQLPHHVDIQTAVKKATDAGLGVIAMKVMAGNYLDKEKKKPVNKTAALKWVLQDENIHTAILTIRTFGDLEEYMAVMENLKLTETEKKDLEYDDTQGSLFCPACGKCQDQCRAHLPIPDIMRAYMYTYGYRDLYKAHDLMTRLNIPDNVCADCGVCTVNCTIGFDVAERISDVARLKSIPSEFLEV